MTAPAPKRCAECRRPSPTYTCAECKATKRRLRDLHQGRLGTGGKESVRCLGPCSPEHTFLSPDRVRVRVCQRCRDYLKQARLSPRAGWKISDTPRGSQ